MKANNHAKFKLIIPIVIFAFSLIAFLAFRPSASATSIPEIPDSVKRDLTIVIDPGHQAEGMTEKEPEGPGSSVMKAKVSSGTHGDASGLSEYQLTLTVGLMLRDELVNRGYTVIMTRETNDVSISNAERAQIANNAGADAFVRLHANSTDDSKIKGAVTMCQTPNNPYNASYYASSRSLSEHVLAEYVSSTHCKRLSLQETDTMTGINWATVPSTIIEMGFMSNPSEDKKMASPDYQKLMVEGIANGIEAYFAEQLGY